MKKFLHMLLPILNIMVAIITITAAYGGMINPSLTVIPALLGLSFPIWIAASILMIFIDLWRRRRLTVIPLLSLFICAGPLWAFCPIRLGNKAELTPSDSVRTFTMMTYNVWGMRDYQNRYTDTIDTKTRHELTRRELRQNGTITFILAEQPDICFVQESLGIGENAAIYETRSQADSLNALYPYTQANPKLDFMSRYPLKKVDLVQPTDSSSWFAAAETEICGEKILLVSVHLRSNLLTDRDINLYKNITHINTTGELKAVKRQLLNKLASAFRIRAAEARLLARQLSETDYDNIIVAGDFNDVPSCYAIRQLEKAGLHNAYDECAAGPMITYHGSRLYFRIDHIMYKGNLKPLAMRRGNLKRSDHYPLFCQFLITRDNETH